MIVLEKYKELANVDEPQTDFTSNLLTWSQEP